MLQFSWLPVSPQCEHFLLRLGTATQPLWWDMNSFTGLHHCPRSELCFISQSIWNNWLGHNQPKYKICTGNASSEEIVLLSAFDVAQLCFHPCLRAAGKRWWVKAGWVTATRCLPRIWLLLSRELLISTWRCFGVSELVSVGDHGKLDLC